MSEITREDLKIILMFALHVAKVDEDLAGLEKQILRRYMELVHLTEDERSELMSGDKSLAHGMEHLSGSEAKGLLVKTLCAVAHSDGVMHVSEREFIDKVNFQLGDLVELLPFEEWETYEHEVLSSLDPMG